MMRIKIMSLLSLYCSCNDGETEIETTFLHRS